MRNLTGMITMLLALALTAACGGGGGTAAPGASGPTIVTLATQTTGFLAEPHAIAVSSKDGMLYVADNTNALPCNGSCIRKVDPVSGAVGTTAVAPAVGIIEGIAFDASNDNLYYTDRQSRVFRMTWNGSDYAPGVICNDVASLKPQDAYHIVADATLGMLVVDANLNAVVQSTTCSAGTTPATLSAASGLITQPRGIALGPLGEILVSNVSSSSSILTVDRLTGAVSVFQNTGLNQPRGIEWLGGTSAWANSLLVADYGSSSVVSVKGAGARVVATLSSPPVDLVVAGGVLYILSAPSGSAPGRIFKSAGF